MDDEIDLTTLLTAKPLARVRAVYSADDDRTVGIEATYTDGEIVMVKVADGCGCCGSPYLYQE